MFDFESTSIEELAYVYAAVACHLRKLELRDPEHRKYELIEEEFNDKLSDLAARNPPKAIELYTALATHPEPECRRNAAVMIVSLTRHDPRFGVELWVKLLMDRDASVATAAEESIAITCSENLLEPDVPMDRVSEAILFLLEYMSETGGR